MMYDHVSRSDELLRQNVQDSLVVFWKSDCMRKYVSLFPSFFVVAFFFFCRRCLPSHLKHPRKLKPPPKMETLFCSRTMPVCCCQKRRDIRSCHTFFSCGDISLSLFLSFSFFFLATIYSRRRRDKVGRPGHHPSPSPSSSAPSRSTLHGLAYVCMDVHVGDTRFLIHGVPPPSRHGQTLG